MSIVVTILGTPVLWPTQGDTNYSNGTTQFVQLVQAALDPIAGLYNGTTGNVGNISLNNSDQLVYDVNGGSPIPIGGGSVTSVGLTSSNLTVTGSPVTTSGTMTVDLPNTAVTPGSYTYASITVDAQGRITAASSGAAPTGTVTSVGVSGNNGISVSGSPITSSGTITLGLGAITPTSVTSSGAVSGTTMSFSGNMSNTGTGTRFLADFSNATTANRFAFQSSTTNGITNVTAIPNGTATQAYFHAESDSSLTNTSRLTLGVSATAAVVSSSTRGTGTQLPMNFNIGSTTKVTIATNGDVTLANDLAVQGGGITAGAGTTPGTVTVRGNGTSQGGIIYVNTDGNDTGVLINGKTGLGQNSISINDSSLNTAISLLGNGQAMLGNTSGVKGDLLLYGDGTTQGGIGYCMNYDNTDTGISFSGGSNTLGGNLTIKDVNGRVALSITGGDGTWTGVGSENYFRLYTPATAAQVGFVVTSGYDTAGATFDLKNEIHTSIINGNAATSTSNPTFRVKDAAGNAGVLVTGSLPGTDGSSVEINGNTQNSKVTIAGGALATGDDNVSITAAGTATNVGINIVTKGTGAVTVTGDISANNLSGTNTGDQTANDILPSQTGNNGKYLTTDGSNVSWATVSTTTPPAGSNTEIQFNSSGSFGASADLTYSAGGLALNNNQTIVGTGRRFYADMSNSTTANRFAFQTSTTNGITNLSVIPNGTATSSYMTVENNSDYTNTSRLTLGITNTAAQIISGTRGTGTAQPLTFVVGGSTRLTIATSGASTFSGALTASSTLAVTGASTLTGAVTAGSGTTAGSVTVRGNGTTTGGSLVVNTESNITGVSIYGRMGAGVSAVELLDASSNITASLKSDGTLALGGGTDRGHLLLNGDGTDGGLQSVFNYNNTYPAISYNGGSSTSGPNLTMFDFDTNIAIQFATGDGSSGAVNQVQVYNTDTVSGTSFIDGGSDLAGAYVSLKGLNANANIDIVSGNTGTGNEDVAITASGAATNIGIDINGKGAGTINLNSIPVLPTYTVATLPTGVTAGMIYVSDATGASVTGSMCFYNGTSWIDVTTGVAVV